MYPLRRTLLLAAAWLCVLPAGAETLLVVRKTGNAVDFMDPGSGLRLAAVPTGNAPHEISVSPDGKRAVVSNYGTREQPGSTVSIIDLEQPQEARRIDLAPHTRPHGVAWYAADRIAVTTEGSRHLLIVDPEDGKSIRTIETAQETSHMVVVSADARRAYVTNIGSGTTTAIDLVEGRKLRDIATGAGSEALALTPDGQELWVAARADGTIAIVDTSTLDVKARLPLPGVPIRIAMTPDGRTALDHVRRHRGTGDIRRRESPRTRPCESDRAAGRRGCGETFRPPGPRERATGGAPGCARWPQRLCRGDDGRPCRPVRHTDPGGPALVRCRWRTRRPR